MKELLIEILTEKLPATPFLKEFPNIKGEWEKFLKEYHLEAEFDFYYTPRRLVFFHPHFKTKQENSLVEFIEAPKNVAYKDGKLSQVRLSFIQKVGIDETQICFREIKGKEVLYYQKELEGKESSETLGEMIENFLKSLHFGKSMRWGTYQFEFIRAIRNIVCVLGEDSVKFQSYGVQSSKQTFVHRSVSYEAFAFKNAKEHFEPSEENFVILDPEKRKEKIIESFKLIETKENLNIAQDDELLEEVIIITEYPNALLGSLESEFLEIPSEVIITSTRENQRYFATFDGKGLSNHFVAVSNAVCKDYSKIIHGNEKMLHARLSDAMSFYKNDLQKDLEPEKLSKMFHLDLPDTVMDKVEREKVLTLLLRKFLDNDKQEAILQALHSSKADLATQMVYEFPNLQGIMGSYYAEKMGLSCEISLAIRGQYLPSQSVPPSSEFSSIAALAYKFDTLLSFFSIGKIPSGTKDPYALRRAVSGILKILLHLGKKFDLNAFLKEVSKTYKSFDLDSLCDSISERIYPFYETNPSFIKAVLSTKDSDLIHMDPAVKALTGLNRKTDFNESFSTFKRLANIATKNENLINESLFGNEAEKKLHLALKESLKVQNLKQKLESLFALKPSIDEFFENVMTNSENEKLKNNRQALIFATYNEFLKIADIKELSL